MINSRNNEREGYGWKSSKVIDGVRTVRCSSWNGFSSFIHEQLTNFESYIFRGHASTTWRLEPTIDRVRDESGEPLIDAVTHLEKFKYASRGRRGQSPSMGMDDNEWWALGQHHGLYTPLLDWSESPFVASYFAFLPDDVKFDEQVVVYALSRKSCERKNRELKEKSLTIPSSKINTLDLIRPLTDENPRLINQRGLFTRVPSQTTIDEWIVSNFKGSTTVGAPLLKIYMPSNERDRALKSLNRMNVNHLSLFPDLDGASRYCNTSAIISQYG
ncbi:MULTISPECIES: FRG domain-containing protein [unclassified Pseudomonas]|uniref:FRG domain-containing protein n=1 Tax=unclassified Pseudomonas TaxID=196821 RepID=UPI001CBBE973|nr:MULTISPECIES: FRG domain-containing protein [unclassified Pseudomonas]